MKIEEEKEFGKRADDKKLITALDEYFSQDRKFIDVSRIPLICQDIRNIHTSLNKIEDNMTWIVRLIIGSVVLAILALVFKP